MREHPATFVSGILFMLVGLAYLLHAFDVWDVRLWRLWPVFVIALGVVILIGTRRTDRGGD
jgi:LiaI-LiaF-like transmembrane region